MPGGIEESHPTEIYHRVAMAHARPGKAGRLAGDAPEPEGVGPDRSEIKLDECFQEECKIIIDSWIFL